MNNLFNPSKIIVNQRMQYVNDFLENIQEQRLILLNNDDHLTNETELLLSSNFIESLIIQINVTNDIITKTIFLPNNRTVKVVLNGNKRLKTLLDFTSGKFKLQGLTYREEFNGLLFENLDGYLQHRIIGTVVRFQEIQSITYTEAQENDVIERLIGHNKYNLKNIYSLLSDFNLT